jgi:hypothetical protein
MPIKNYTSIIAVNKSMADINKILQGRVASVSTHYAEDGSPSGLAFSIRTPHGIRNFMMTANVAGVHATLNSDPKVARMYRTVEHAQRVAWRIIKDWLDAQLALIEADLASMDQVMLPYLVVHPDGTTLYENYKTREQSALEA